MHIENLILPYPMERVKASKEIEATKKKYRQKKGSSTAKALTNRVEKHDVVNEIAQADPGINTGQLDRGDVKEATSMINGLLGGRMTKNLVASIGGKGRD